MSPITIGPGDVFGSSGQVDPFTAASPDNIITGTATGDSGIAILAVGKGFHLGGTVSVIEVTQGNALGFFNAATPATKQTVTGSRGANAALASLLTALATYGLVTDSSSV